MEQNRGRRGSMLWAQTIREEQTDKLTLPQISNAANVLSTIADSDSERRGSNIRRRSSQLLPGNLAVIAGGRRPSIRNLAHHRGGGMTRSKTDAELMEETIPLEAPPLFVTSMSLEAQFTILKCYEDILRSKISSDFPEYSQVLQRSSSPQSILCPDTCDDEDDVDSLDRYTQRYEHDVVELPAITTHRSEALEKLSAISMKGVAVGSGQSSFRRRLSTQSQQQNVSKRLHFAHLMMDSFKGEQSLSTSPFLRSAKNLNPIKSYNWWTGAWSHEFQAETK